MYITVYMYMYSINFLLFHSPAVHVTQTKHTCNYVHAALREVSHMFVVSKCARETKLHVTISYIVRCI